MERRLPPWWVEMGVKSTALGTLLIPNNALFSFDGSSILYQLQLQSGLVMLLNLVPAGSSQPSYSCLPQDSVPLSVVYMIIHPSFLSSKILLLSRLIEPKCVRFTACGTYLAAWTPEWLWMQPNTKSWPYLEPYELLCNFFLKLDCMVLKHPLYRWQYWVQCQWLDMLVRLAEGCPP